MVPRYSYDPGPDSITVFYRNSNSMEISFHSHLHSYIVIATNFHVQNWWPATELQQGEVSIKFELPEKSLVKRAPGWGNENEDGRYASSHPSVMCKLRHGNLRFTKAKTTTSFFENRLEAKRDLSDFVRIDVAITWKRYCNLMIVLLSCIKIPSTSLSQ